ncbi:MAG: bifunctional precorrin-2 dehydrogenase/sirohydrochlorin ferrochelatase [Actinobacteria bacterium]|nr:bifunctional precorrin-2 dehydrogenase/sirohydrochlorin ferrochelatase [Actinomycetota bacterium]
MPLDTAVYPVNLVVDGRRCLVVGGGAVATGKVRNLRAAGAIVHVVAPEISDEIAAMADVTVERRRYRQGEVAGYRLAIAATGDPAVNGAVFSDGEAAGVWVNSADDPARCAFTLPSVVRQGALTVTVSTGGHSPALSRWLADRFERAIGPEYSVLVDLLSAERRAAKAAGRSTEDLDWQKALDSDMLALIKAGQIQQARERLQACLSSSSA